MKGIIKVEVPGQGKIEFDYDSKNPKTIWVEITSPPGMPRNDRDHCPTHVYKLIVGAKGGLTLK